MCKECLAICLCLGNELQITTGTNKTLNFSMCNLIELFNTCNNNNNEKNVIQMNSNTRRDVESARERTDI